MHLPSLQRMSSVAAAALFATSPLLAQIELNPNLTLSGYLTGSARYVDNDGDDNSTLDLDAALLLANLNFAPVTGTFSYYYSDDTNPELLDAYIAYDCGGGTTVTAGKFLSWHGYEAFHIPSMLQITYSNDLAAIIPGYHKGIKLDYASGASKMGVAVLDSVYGTDGNLDDGFGLEAYYSYSADNLTAYLGLAWETNDFDDGEGDFDEDSWLIDLWLQYVAGSVTYAGELAYGSTDSDFSGEDTDAWFWSLLADIALSEKGNLLLRLSGGEEEFDDDGVFTGEFIKGTIAYRQKCSDNFALVYEGSYTSFDDAFDGENVFLGVQGRFTF